MRLAPLPILLCLAIGPARAEPPAKPPAKAPPVAAAVVGCPSLANFRLLMREAKGEAAAASATLADPKADHLGCVAIAGDRVAGLSDHVALGGQAYDCVGLQGTAICHWVLAGSIVPARSLPSKTPAQAAPDKAKR